jgi:hypothetical protein
MIDIKSQKIAIVGVSHKEDKFGFRIFRDLIGAGYDVAGVNPSDGTVAGRKIYRSLKELPEKPYLVITVVPAAVTEQVVEQCHELGIKMVWMQPGSESEKAIAQADKYKISVIHNACFMMDIGLW